MKAIKVTFTTLCAAAALVVVAAPAQAGTPVAVCLRVHKAVQQLPGYEHLSGGVQCRLHKKERGYIQFVVWNTQPGHRYVGIINMYPYTCDGHQRKVCWNAEIVRFVGNKK